MKKEIIKTLNLKEVIANVISGDEYRGIMGRELCLGQLTDICCRVGEHLFPGVKAFGGVTMAWNFTEQSIYDAPMGNVRLHLDHDTAVVTVTQMVWK